MYILITFLFTVVTSYLLELAHRLVHGSACGTGTESTSFGYNIHLFSHSFIQRRLEKLHAEESYKYTS